MRTRCRSLASVAPRVAIGDRGRSAIEMNLYLPILATFLVASGCTHHDQGVTRPLILSDRSSDITADITRMWATAPFESDTSKIASTERALGKR